MARSDEMIGQQPVKVFQPQHWAQRLDVPPGTRYVEADDVETMAEALRRGLAVHSSSCGGQVFIWPDPAGGFQVNHFFQGPPRRRRFETIEQAVGFTASCLI